MKKSLKVVSMLAFLMGVGIANANQLEYQINNYSGAPLTFYVSTSGMGESSAFQSRTTIPDNESRGETLSASSDVQQTGTVVITIVKSDGTMFPVTFVKLAQIEQPADQVWKLPSPMTAKDRQIVVETKCDPGTNSYCVAKDSEWYNTYYNQNVHIDVYDIS